MCGESLVAEWNPFELLGPATESIFFFKYDRIIRSKIPIGFHSATKLSQHAMPMLHMTGTIGALGAKYWLVLSYFLLAADFSRSWSPVILRPVHIF